MRKFSFAQATRELRLGGHKDALALTAMAISILLLCPFLKTGYPLLEKITAAALMFPAVWWIASRYAQCWLYAPYLTTGMAKMRPSGHLPVEVDKHGQPEKEGLMLGYTVDSGKPVYVPYDDLMRHAIIVGQSGVGKTVAGSLLFMQQIERGGGAVLIDGKLNSADLLKVYQMASYFGREADVLVINPGVPSQSNTYNPILYGDPDEVAARILSLIPSTVDDAAVDYYKQAANQGLIVIVAAIKRLGLAYNFMDLSILLMNTKALEELEGRLPECDEKINLTLFLDQFRDFKGFIDTKKMKEIFGGIGGRLFTFGSGNFGEITSSYNPDIKLTEALLQKKIVYVMLPTMGKDIAAGNFGQMMVSDLRSSIAELQEIPADKKPWPPTLAFMDEAGAYVSGTWSRMFEQARSAHVMMLPAVQTLANLKAVNEELSEMVLGNTWTKIFFKVGTQATADECAELIGKEFAVTRSLSTSSGESSSAQAMSADPEQGQGSSYGINFSESEQELYRVSADDLKALSQGEAIVLFGGSEIYNIRIPMLSFDESYTCHVEHIRINRPVTPQFVKGMSLYENSEQYIDNNTE